MNWCREAANMSPLWRVRVLFHRVGATPSVLQGKTSSPKLHVAQPFLQISCILHGTMLDIPRLSSNRRHFLNGLKLYSCTYVPTMKNHAEQARNKKPSRSTLYSHTCENEWNLSLKDSILEFLVAFRKLFSYISLWTAIGSSPCIRKEKHAQSVWTNDCVMEWFSLFYECRRLTVTCIGSASPVSTRLLKDTAWLSNTFSSLVDWVHTRQKLFIVV